MREDMIERIRGEVVAAIEGHCRGDDLWMAAHIAAERIAALAAQCGEPVAWYVPHIVSFKDATKTSCPVDLQPKLEGEVAWGVSMFGDASPVQDKHGVKHVPRPLVFGGAPPSQPEGKMDIFDAYKNWPADIRAKLSVHDLRRMNGWAPKPTGAWTIDHSAGRPILVYENCSVIEDEQARYLLGLIAADLNAQPVALPDQALCRFYGVDSWESLVAAQEEHVLKLQDAARRNVKPWEDTFPPTLLPKYLRDSGLAAAPAGEGVQS